MDQFHQLYIQNKPFVPQTEGIQKAPKPGKVAPSKEDKSVSFEEVLDQSVQKQEQLKFSAHAQERIRSRDIRMDERQLARLGEGVSKAAEKGASEALVLVDQIAAIVSVDNNTVITVADTGMLRNNVFTNIDSAVIT